jgi:hypothetical protein
MIALVDEKESFIVATTLWTLLTKDVAAKRRNPSFGSTDHAGVVGYFVIVQLSVIGAAFWNGKLRGTPNPIPVSTDRLPVRIEELNITGSTPYTSLDIRLLLFAFASAGDGFLSK